MLLRLKIAFSNKGILSKLVLQICINLIELPSSAYFTKCKPSYDLYLIPILIQLCSYFNKFVYIGKTNTEINKSILFIASEALTKTIYLIPVTNLHGTTARGSHGLPEVSLGPTMPNPAGGHPETAFWTGSLQPSSTPLDTPRHTPLQSCISAILHRYTGVL
jgi:hypothetical protein